VIPFFLAVSLAFAQEAPDSAVADAAVAVEPVADPRAGWTAEQWIDAVDAKAASIPGMRYSVERTTVRDGQTVVERWRIVSWGTQFRIDYFGDTARQITFDGAILLDYIPVKHAAQRWRVSAMPADDAAAVLSRILGRVAVPGFRLGRAEGVTWTAAAGPDHTVILDGAGHDDTHLRYVIATDKTAVLSTDLDEGGRNVLHTVSSDLREVAPGVWLPHAVELRTPDTGGETRVSVRLTKVTVLVETPPNSFDTSVDPSISIEEKP
jgi:hypothetical protein